MAKVKRANSYCSAHKILLVGEGDFSFSLSLATAFGSASNIVTTSLDSYGVLLKKYRKAQSNVQRLKRMGATVLHEIDTTQMKYNVDLSRHKFDRIVFNFPHAGFKGKEDSPAVIRLHQVLLLGFFCNARQMLLPLGEIHVRHKTSAPFCNWNLANLADLNSLTLLASMAFRIKDYPGYNNKRGDGSRSDEPFPLGECSTFIFIHKDYFHYPYIDYTQMKEAPRGMSPEYIYHRNHVKLCGSSSSGSSGRSRMEGVRREAVGTKVEVRREAVGTKVEEDKAYLRALVLLYGKIDGNMIKKYSFFLEDKRFA